jgi:hypothetical protein
MKEKAHFQSYEKFLFYFILFLKSLFSINGYQPIDGYKPQRTNLSI